MLKIIFSMEEYTLYKNTLWQSVILHRIVIIQIVKQVIGFGLKIYPSLSNNYVLIIF